MRHRLRLPHDPGRRRRRCPQGDGQPRRRGNHQLQAVHDHMSFLVREAGGRIDYIAFCPHSPEDQCSCRKPETGLLDEIEKKLDCSLKKSFFIGDKESDILCANNYGCIPLLVKTGYGERTLSSKHCPPKERCFINLLDAVNFILKPS